VKQRRPWKQQQQQRRLRCHGRREAGASSGWSESGGQRLRSYWKRTASERAAAARQLGAPSVSHGSRVGAAAFGGSYDLRLVMAKGRARVEVASQRLRAAAAADGLGSDRQPLAV